MKDSYIPRTDFRGTGNSGSLSEEISSGPPLKVNPAGRVCKTKGCNTPLARLNPNDHCYTHQREINRAMAMNAPRNKKKAS